MTAEEIREAEERQEVLMQAFPSARYDVLPTTVDDGPPVVRGVPPPMVGTKPGQINTAYAARDVPGETPEEQKERAAALYAQQLADSGGAPDAGGSLSAPPGALVDPRALALQINPLEELEYARNVPLPDHTEAGKRMQDAQGNFIGLKKQEGFSREAQIARARELYGQIPNERESRWEDEFLQDRKRYTDKDIQRSFMIQSLLHGQEHGMKFREMARGEQADYDKGLQSARQADAARQRVSPALAEAIAGAGLASPEAAVELRMNDPLVKAFTSGGYSQGLAAERILAGQQKNTENNATKIEIADQGNKAQLERTVTGKLLGIQAALANRGITADMSLPNSTNLEYGVSRLMERFPQLTPDQAIDGMLGRLESIPESIRREVSIAVPGIKKIANDAGATRATAVSQDKLEAEADEKEESAVSKSIALAKNNPKFALEWQTDWEQTAIPLKSAIAAWRDMSPRSKKAFVQWSSEGFAGAIQDYLTEPQDQAKAGAVRALIDSYIKGLGGSAVTGNEWIRIAKEIGISNAPWSPFKSTTGLEGFLDRSAQLLTSHRKQYEGIMGGWKTGQRAEE